MLLYEIPMLWHDILMLCYAMVYVAWTDYLSLIKPCVYERSKLTMYYTINALRPGSLEYISAFSGMFCIRYYLQRSHFFFKLQQSNIPFVLLYQRVLQNSNDFDRPVL